MVSGSKLANEVALRREKYCMADVAGARLQECGEAHGVRVGGALIGVTNHCCGMSALRDRIFLVGIVAVFLTALV